VGATCESPAVSYRLKESFALFPQLVFPASVLRPGHLHHRADRPDSNVQTDYLRDYNFVTISQALPIVRSYGSEKYGSAASFVVFQALLNANSSRLIEGAHE